MSKPKKTRTDQTRGRNQPRRRAPSRRPSPPSLPHNPTSKQSGATPSPSAPDPNLIPPRQGTQVDNVDNASGNAQAQIEGKPRRDWKTVFLDALRLDANVSAACRTAKISREAAYNAREIRGKEDAALDDAKAFAAAWDSAIEEALDDLEAEARRRAMVGVPRKKFTRTGDAIIDPATHRQYVEFEMSDALMQFLLRVHRYGDKHQHEISGPGGAPIALTDYSKLEDGDLDAEIDKLLAKRRAALGGIIAGTGSAPEGETA